MGESTDLHCAAQFAREMRAQIHPNFDIKRTFDCHIDALFGIGLNRELNIGWQQVIQKFNEQSGLKFRLIYRVAYKQIQDKSYPVQ